MFGRKKKEPKVEEPEKPEVPSEVVRSEEQTASAGTSSEAAAVEVAPAAAVEAAVPAKTVTPVSAPGARGNRVQKVGTVASDKMQKTVVVRVDRLVMHTKYRRYVRRTTKFKAHDDLGAAVGDRVRIVETRPLSAQKRWRVVEILQKAAK